MVWIYPCVFIFLALYGGSNILTFLTVKVQNEGATCCDQL